MSPLDPAAQRARQTHRGVFITGPGKLELIEDELPGDVFDGSHIITEALGNCRCSSDKKAIVQFHAHARIPASAERVALGHEVVQRVVEAPGGSPVSPGDLVLITPGHVATPHDPETFQPDPEKGVLTSLGYSYRYLGGLRQFNALPVDFIDIVRDQGFGNLFSRIPRHEKASLASLAHAEPFACCYGTIRNMFYRDEKGQFSYGIPPRARVAFLGGTARMAMIKLTILAARPDDELPERVGITGSPRKLEDLADYALIRDLKRRGVEVILVDRSAPDLVEQLTGEGLYNAVFTNYPSQEVFDQAVKIIERGGNLNNYAGAVDPDIAFDYVIDVVPPSDSPAEEARARIADMHHNRGHNDPVREGGLAKEPRVALLGMSGQFDRLRAFLAELPAGAEVELEGIPSPELTEDFGDLEFVDAANDLTDVFIAGRGSEARAIYEQIEPRLARSAAVNLIDGDTTLRIRSRHIHYASRHQICGPTIPYTFTNTSEPVAEDLARQGDEPIDFDWMVKGVSGLGESIEMIEEVTEKEPFGSFFVLTQLETFPHVAVSSEAFLEKAASLEEGSADRLALEAGARVLASNGDVWSREVERAIFAAHGLEHPLD